MAMLAAGVSPSVRWELKRLRAARTSCAQTPPVLRTAGESFSGADFDDRYPVGFKTFGTLL